jgi:hypothetical protein
MCAIIFKMAIGHVLVKESNDKAGDKKEYSRNVKECGRIQG